MNNTSSRCLNEKYLQFSVNTVEHVLIGYLSLIIIIFGFIGNLINLSVLIAPGMINRYKQQCNFPLQLQKVEYFFKY
jgi:hypothetical protein